MSEEENISIESTYSNTAIQLLKKTFGSKYLSFFTLYEILKAFYESEAQGQTAYRPESGFAEAFRDAIRPIFVKYVVTEERQSAFKDSSALILNQLKKLDYGSQLSVSNFNIINEEYIRLIHIATRSRDLYFKTVQHGTPGWASFKVMSPSETQKEKIREQSPETYQLLENQKEIYTQIDTALVEKIQKGGLILGKKRFMGRMFATGIDPVTKEVTVYETNGRVTPEADFEVMFAAEEKATANLRRVNPENLDDLRRYPPEMLEGVQKKDITYMSLTDDTIKNSLTRMFPTAKINGEDVILEGRFKGIAVADMVNREGRMIEGTAYYFDTKLETPRPVPIETKGKDGVVVTANKEPYVTLNTDGRFYLRVPGVHEYAAIRNAMKGLAKLDPNIQAAAKVQGERALGFYFPASSFAGVKDALQSLVLSKSAAAAIEEYYKSLTKIDRAIAKENLKRFAPDQIGGFKPGVQIYSKQRQFLAWSELRGDNGLCGLGTGVGKTMQAIAYIQNLRSRQVLKEGEKILYVCPKTLTGNLAKEAIAFMEDPRSFMDHVDVINYTEFQKESDRDPNFMSRYVAVLFDEAQTLYNPNSKVSRAAQRHHPRKVLLTASPMDNKPEQAFVLAGICDNVDFTTKEAKKALQAFKKRFTVEIGGRAVSVKRDPETLRELQTRMKQMIYYADKEDVEEYELQRLQKKTIAVTMDPQVEMEYRKITESMPLIFRGLAAKYKNHDPKQTNSALESARVKLASVFSRLNMLANMPQELVPGASNPKLEFVINSLKENAESKLARTLLFTDDARFADYTARELSKVFPGKMLAVGLSDKIIIYRSGEAFQTYREKVYQDRTTGKLYPKEQWKMFVVENYIKPIDSGVMAACLTATYSTGLNLQTFNKVIHLDRDSFNAETITQRTARAHRQGQLNSVEELTVDATFNSQVDELDVTLDEIRKFIQDTSSELFDELIRQSQTVALGQEYLTIKQRSSSYYKTTKKLAELLMSPLIANSAKAGDEDSFNHGAN